VIDESDLLMKVHDDPALFKTAVESAMTTKLHTLAPRASLKQLEDVLNQGLVAIVADERAFYGLITRVDLLNHLRRRLA
jgi:cystathionine beta-synthase